MKGQNVIFIEELDPVRKRRIINKSRSLSGLMPSDKNNEHVWFESALERDFAILLEAHPDVSHYQEQPLTIEYDVDGKTKRYTPDFLVHFIDKRQKPWLCEIKYRDELREKFDRLKPKLRAGIDHANSQKWEFRIFTERDIRTPHLENLNFLDRYNTNGLDGACYKLVLRTLSVLGHTTPKEFMLTVKDAHYNQKGRCLYALWYGIKSGDIGCDIINEKLTMNSEIWLSEPLNFNDLE